MKLCLKLLAIVVVAAITVSPYSLTGCSAPPSFSYKNVTVSISSTCYDCAAAQLNSSYSPAYPQPPSPGSVLLMPPGGTNAQGGVANFTATVTNAPQTNVTWTIYPTPNLGSITNVPTGTSLPIGESSDPVGQFYSMSGNTAYYGTPTGVPIYSGAALAQANALGIPQGDILVVASVPADPNNPSVVATASQLIQMYNTGSPSAYLTPSTGSTPAGQTQPEVTVARNTSFAFTGGIVGAPPCTSVATCGNVPVFSTDNGAVWAVGPANFSLGTAIVGGNSVYGTITQQGVYTAPATIPTTTNSSTSINGEVVVVVYSDQLNTKNAYAYVGIN